MPEISISRRLSTSGTITIACRQIPIRVRLFWAGVTFWIGNMVLQTGWAEITELRASLYFVAEMVVITSATRTITLDRVASVYCLGGAMMGVMWLISAVFTSFVPSPDAISRQFFIPFMEESLKLAPVVFILWRQLASRSWTMGASDIMLMAATCGAGFGLVEEAYFHHALGPTLALDWFPLTRINGATLTVGHGSWTGLAGATLGLALLWRPRKPLNYLLAGSGILWSIIDHSHHNYGVDRTGFSVDFFNFVTGHGWISLYLFVFGVIAVVGSDLYAVRGMLSSRPQLGLQGGKPPEIHGRAIASKGCGHSLSTEGLLHMCCSGASAPRDSPGKNWRALQPFSNGTCRSAHWRPRSVAPRHSNPGVEIDEGMVEGTKVSGIVSRAA